MVFLLSLEDNLALLNTSLVTDRVTLGFGFMWGSAVIKGQMLGISPGYKELNRGFIYLKIEKK